jgi:nucleoside-diphosphate-sugar epimerase
MLLMLVSVAKWRDSSTPVRQVSYLMEFMEFLMQMNQCLTQIRSVSYGFHYFDLSLVHAYLHHSWHDVFLLQFNDSYSETKADAEKLVMRANGREGLLTCCIRPSSIFGPGDKLLVPSLVAAARAGKSKVRTDAYLSMLSLVTTDDCMYILTTLIDRFRLSF